jgi:hypothetical protein
MKNTTKKRRGTSGRDKVSPSERMVQVSFYIPQKTTELYGDKNKLGRDIASKFKALPDWFKHI